MVRPFLDNNKAKGEVVTSRCHGMPLDDDKPIKSLKVYSHYFKLFGKSWRNFLWDRIYRYLSSVKKESDNFCVVFTYSIKRAREIKKFHVVAV